MSSCFYHSVLTVCSQMRFAAYNCKKLPGIWIPLSQQKLSIRRRRIQPELCVQNIRSATGKFIVKVFKLSRVNTAYYNGWRFHVLQNGSDCGATQTRIKRSRGSLVQVWLFKVIHCQVLDIVVARTVLRVLDISA